ncbi:uncharacterized protein LOC101238093 isoform X1 [Hydra vulgaris]|uniref:uncharacterized protein LOC101238093 isoform X1 n=1 Tax=Hydra vulgaris TaxID=6087 RepID=UPI001F5E3848|nr:uncharacterized protein LOC101238093 [Hydra vulgaris]
MLIYVESKVFPNKTFVLLLNQFDTIARARAQMLHILYELGKSNHQFRFRFNKVYLRDAYTFEDYKILDSSVIKMVPMAKMRREILTDTNIQDDHDGNIKKIERFKDGIIDEVQQALLKEITIFNRRETLLSIFRILLWIHLLAAMLSLSTVYVYSAIWTAVIVFYGFIFCPNYTRLGGYVGTSSLSKEYFFATFGIGLILNLTASITMGTFLLLDAMKHGCAELKGDCGYVNIWSIVFYYGHSIFLISTVILVLFLNINCKVEVGDIIEYYLVQNKDVAKVLLVAKIGRMKERRNAAFELASLAATGDDAKAKIVENEGLQVLMNLALCSDEATQEYSTEALAELLTVSSIQDKFIELGGARTLCALLHSASKQLMNEAVMAISYIVSDSETNRHAIVADDGLYDISSAAKRASPLAARIIAGIYLELSFSPSIRTSLAEDAASASALETLCKSHDDETKRLALQTIELLVIENQEFITSRAQLLDYLIQIPTSSSDDQLCLLAGKILLYYAEIKKTCAKLVASPGLKDSLLQLACNPDPVLQNVVVKIILAILENIEDRHDALSIGTIEVLTYLHETCLDRETWEMAEKAIDILHGLTIQKKISEDSRKASSTKFSFVQSF